MTYYDELGVGANANADEIRQAYRELARLLHPDTQADEKLRQAAERQMRRVNEIVATLTNPVRRSAYDRSLGPGPVVPFAETAGARFRGEESAWTDLVFRHWSWVLIGALLAGLAIWSGTSGEPPVAALQQEIHPEDSKPVETPRPKRASTASPRRAPKQEPPPAEEPPGPQPMLHLGREAANAIDLPAPPPSEPAVSKPAPRLEPTADPREPQPVENLRFAGNWLYAVESSRKTEESQYVATYVEVVLSQESGNLSGTYWGRYRVPNQAISSEVRFRLQGEAPGGNLAKLRWTSADGARGEAELLLNSGGFMTLNWWTTELGRRAGLASGSARLIRQAKP